MPASRLLGLAEARSCLAATPFGLEARGFTLCS